MAFLAMLFPAGAGAQEVEEAVFFDSLATSSSWNG